MCRVRGAGRLPAPTLGPGMGRLAVRGEWYGVRPAGAARPRSGGVWRALGGLPNLGVLGLGVLRPGISASARGVRAGRNAAVSRLGLPGSHVVGMLVSWGLGISGVALPRSRISCRAEAGEVGRCRGGGSLGLKSLCSFSTFFKSVLDDFQTTFARLLRHFWTTFKSLLDDFQISFARLLNHFSTTFKSLLDDFQNMFARLLNCFLTTFKSLLDNFQNVFHDF